MTTIAEMLVKFGADTASFDAKLNEMQRKSSELSGKFGEMGKTMTTKVTAPLVGLGVAAVAVGAKFDASMSNVAAISGATGDEFEALRAKAREMGANTSKSASEAADALSYMALAGWDTTQMIDGLEPILRLSEAGNIDLARASDLVTDSMSAMGLQVKDLPGYLDMVAQASRKSNTDIDALMEAFMITGGTLSSFGVPLEESTALLGVLANRGYKGAQAGTAMNAIFTNLTSGMGAAGKAMDELGLSAFDANGDFKGLEAVLFEVKEATDGMTDEQRANYISMIAGKEHLKTFQALMSGLGDEYQDLKGDVSSADGALMTMSSTMQDNLLGDLKAMWSAIQELAIQINDILSPYIRAAVQAMTEMASKLGNLPEGFMIVVVAIAGLVAAIGPMLLGIAGALKLWSIMAGAASVLGGAIGAISLPVLAVVAAIAALTAGIVYLWNTNETFRTAVIAIWEGIKEAISVAVQFIVEFVMQIWGGLTEWWAENGAQILATAQMIWSAISNAIVAVAQYIVGYIMEWWTFLQGLWEAHGASLIAIAMTIWNTISTAITAAMSFIRDIIMQVASKIEEFWNKHGQTIIAFTTAMWEALKVIIDVATVIIKGIIDFFLAGIKILFDTWWPIITSVLEVAWELIKTIVDTAIDVVAGLIDLGMALITGDWEAAWEAIKGIASDIWEGIEGFFSSVDLWQIGKDIIQGLIDGIGSMAEAAWTKAKEIAGGIVGAVTGVMKIHSPSRVMRDDVGKHIGSGLVIGMDAMEHEIDNASLRMANAAMPSVDQPQFSGVGGSSGAQTIIIQSVLDGQVIAENTYEYHDLISGRQQAINNTFGGIR